MRSLSASLRLRGLGHLARQAAVLVFYLLVFGAQFLVLFVEAVDFLYIVAQECAQGVNLAAEFGNFCRALVLLVVEFLLQFLDLYSGSLVFVVELALYRVVGYEAARVFELQRTRR